MQAQRTNRVVLMLSDGEVAEIQDFRFANRVGSQSGALRTLINHGLKAMKTNGPAATAIAPDQDQDQPR